MTGTMNPQGKGSGLFGGSSLPGTYAAATTRSGSSGVDPIAANLLLTWGNTAEHVRAPPSASTEPSTIPPTTT
jgi:hypothetical protein